MPEKELFDELFVSVARDLEVIFILILTIFTIQWWQLDFFEKKDYKIAYWNEYKKEIEIN